MRTTPTEAETQKAILEYLAARRIFAGRLNTGAGFVEGRPIHHHTFGKGCADILAFTTVRRVFFNGTDSVGLDTKSLADRFEVICDSFVPTWIEVKAPGKKQRPEQVGFQQHVESLGHTYLLVDSIDQVMKWVEGLCL